MNMIDRVVKQTTVNTYTSMMYVLEQIAIPEIKDVIYDDYNRLLTNTVTERKSKSRPEDYIDDFMDSIDEFEYIVPRESGMTLRTPDMDNFKFKGRLKVIEQILNGTSGIYMEISEVDYIKVSGKKKINLDPIDEFVPQKNRFYLIRHSDPLLKKDPIVTRQLVRYPFSNTPPIDLFDGVNKYVNNNINKWIGLSLKELN